MPISNFVNDPDEPAASPAQVRESAHLVQFYEADSFLLEALSRLIGDNLVAGDSSVVIATKAHREGLEEALRARGLDLDTLRRQGRYVALDAAETLASLMVNDFPDENRFRDVVGDVIKRAIEKSERHHLSAYREMVALLFAVGKGDALLRLEELWNALGKELPFSLCCGYPLNQFSERPDEPLFLKICAEHSHVVPAESYTELASPDERRRSVTRLQHKAQMLEGEKSGRKRAEKSFLYAKKSWPISSRTPPRASTRLVRMRESCGPTPRNYACSDIPPMNTSAICSLIFSFSAICLTTFGA